MSLAALQLGGFSADWPAEKLAAVLPNIPALGKAAAAMRDDAGLGASQADGGAHNGISLARIAIICLFSRFWCCSRLEATDGLSSCRLMQVWPRRRSSGWKRRRVGTPCLACRRAQRLHCSTGTVGAAVVVVGAMAGGGDNGTVECSCEPRKHLSTLAEGIQAGFTLDRPTCGTN